MQEESKTKTIERAEEQVSLANCKRVLHMNHHQQRFDDKVVRIERASCI